MKWRGFLHNDENLCDKNPKLDQEGKSDSEKITTSRLYSSHCIFLQPKNQLSCSLQNKKKEFI